MSRTFEDKPAVRQSVPLLLGLMGPSGGGKTYSALELATGIQEVIGGDIYGIDTESNRMLMYAEYFKFRHISFKAPFGSLDYLEAMQHCVNKGAKIVITDSLSHEHEGPGGMLDFWEKEQDRMAGEDWQKRDRIKMLAIQKPKQHRRRLINTMLQMDCNFISCFRAKETAKPMKVRDKNGQMKTEVVQLGFMPIAGDEFVFEQTLNCLLLPNAKGYPSWQSDNQGEEMMIKLPRQFEYMFDPQKHPNGRQLNREIGRELAEWARGGASVDPALAALIATGDEKAALGVDTLKTWWSSLPAGPHKTMLSRPPRRLEANLRTEARRMKITKDIDIRQEVEIHLSAEDVAAAISEPGVDCDRAVCQGLNNCVQFMRAIPDEIISKWSEDKKRIVRDALSTQASRF